MNFITYDDYTFDSSYLIDYEQFDSDEYYFKPFYIQELIGSRLANIIELDTVNYKIFKNMPFGQDIAIASIDFKKDENDYFNIIDFNNYNSELEETLYLESHLPYYLNYCIDDKNREVFLNKFIKLVALDTYMRQKDRCRVNIILSRNKDTKYFDFSPIFDYERSFERILSSQDEYVDNFFYRNPIYPLTTQKYPIFIDEFPQFIVELKKLQGINLISELISIGEEYHFTIPDQKIEHYKVQEDISQKLLQKILN